MGPCQPATLIFTIQAQGQNACRHPIPCLCGCHMLCSCFPDLDEGPLILLSELDTANREPKFSPKEWQAHGFAAFPGVWDRGDIRCQPPGSGSYLLPRQGPLLLRRRTQRTRYSELAGFQVLEFVLSGPYWYALHGLLARRIDVEPDERVGIEGGL